MNIDSEKFRSGGKKVLQILPIQVLPLIGPCLRCMRQCQGLRKNGYDVTLLSRRIPQSILDDRNSKNFNDPYFEGIKVFCRLPSLPTVFLREIANLVYSWWIILRTINEIKPHIVHVHNPPETIAFITSILCSLKKIPFVYDVHDGAYELISSLEINPVLKRIYLAAGLFFEKGTLKRCSGILTVSEALKIAMIKRVGKYIGEKPFEVMKNINPQMSNLADGYRKEPEGNYILFSGTLYTAIMGLEDMFDVMPDINRETGVKLVIAGDGPYRRNLEDYVIKKGINDLVEFLGHISRERLYEVINKAKLCIVTFKKSPQQDVALPNKVFEYMAFGKAVVYQDLPGFMEVLGADNEGKYIPDDKADLARVVKRILLNDELRKEVGEKNRGFLRTITFEKEFSKLLDMYDMILGKPLDTGRQRAGQ